MDQGKSDLPIWCVHLDYNKDTKAALSVKVLMVKTCSRMQSREAVASGPDDVLLMVVLSKPNVVSKSGDTAMTDTGNDGISRCYDKTN